MSISRYKKHEKAYHKKIANRSCENVAKFKYLVATLTDHNFTHEEMNTFGQYFHPFSSESFAF
jgi:hypothetical protein